jgi:hypothetical protein
MTLLFLCFNSRLSGLFGQSQYCFKIIILIRFDAVFKTAVLASIVNKFFPARNFNAFWLHQTPATLLPVARFNINMPRPKTIGTMVSVARARNFLPAMVTNKIFFFSLEFLGLHIYIFSVIPAYEPESKILDPESSMPR